MGYIAHSFCLQTRFERLVTAGTRKLGRRQNSSIWSFLVVFVGYSTQFLAPDTISTARDPRVHANWDVIKTHRFGHFWPFSWAIAHIFLASEMISTSHDPGYTKIGTSSKLVDLVISGSFREL